MHDIVGEAYHPCPVSSAHVMDIGGLRASLIEKESTIERFLERVFNSERMSMKKIQLQLGLGKPETELLSLLPNLHL